MEGDLLVSPGSLLPADWVKTLGDSEAPTLIGSLICSYLASFWMTRTGSWGLEAEGMLTASPGGRGSVFDIEPSSGASPGDRGSVGLPRSIAFDGLGQNLG